MPSKHARGEQTMNELAAIVDKLGQECPWTKAQRTADMLFWLRKEIIEVEEVLRSSNRDTAKLTKELGDCLFDVLMAVECTRREYPEVTLQAVQASAVEKVKRRCPYVFGDSVPASTVAEAEAAWQAAKGREQRSADGPSDASSLVAELEGSLQLDACASQSELRAPQRMEEPNLTTTTPPPECRHVATVTSPVHRPTDAGDESDDSFDTGLAEWENDYKRDAGPPSDGEDSSDLDQ